MPLEALRYAITPVGLHYLLIHFDIPMVDASNFELAVGGHVRQPLPPQHGFPLRLIVPGWYGMTHVKWLRSITVIDREFAGFQQASAYHYRTTEGDPGVPVTRMLPRALMLPPGVPDFMSRTRFVDPSTVVIEGRAWSGCAPITGVDFSSDGGESWVAAALEDSVSPYAWRRWSIQWDAMRIGDVELCARASDAAGNVQPLGASWNLEGVQNNSVQRVRVVVGTAEGRQAAADSV